MKYYINLSRRQSREPTTLPINHGQVVRVHRPIEPILYRLDFLQLHRQPTLVDLSFGEDAEVGREPEVFAEGDEPFGWIPLVPFRSVPVVHRKLVMEVMVPLPEGHKSRNEVVPRGVLIVECAFAQPMS